MTKATKIWLIVAASLVTLGLIACIGALFMIKFDFSNLNTAKYETNTHDIIKDFDDISLETDTADITFLPSDDEKCKVVCYEMQKVKHSVTVTDGALTVSVSDTRKWFDHISFFSFGTPKITVYLPKEEYASLSITTDTGDINIPKDLRFERIEAILSTGDVSCYASASESLKIKTSTGDIKVDGISVGALGLSTSTGKISASGVSCAGDIAITVSTGKTYLTNITCKNLTSSGSTGDIHLEHVFAEEKFNIKRSTGDVDLEGCDAAELMIKTDTGDVCGTLLSEKIFIARTDTGRIDVPSTVGGGRCEITTDTGDIRISVIQ